MSDKLEQKHREKMVRALEEWLSNFLPYMADGKPKSSVGSTDLVGQITLPKLREELAMLLLWMTKGCGNHGCRVAKVKGQGTNGPCRCNPREVTDALLNLTTKVDANKRNWPTK